MRPVPLLNSGLASPFEQFFLVLGIVSAMPLLVGAPPPESLAHLLSPLLVRSSAPGGSRWGDCCDANHGTTRVYWVRVAIRDKGAR